MAFYSIALVFWPAALILLSVAAATDLKDRRIPDEVTIAVAAIGLAHGLLVRPATLWLSLVVAVIVFLGLAVLSHHRIIGGGDLKLITAVTLLVPPGHVGRLLVDIVLAGGAVASVYVAARLGLRLRAAPASSPSARGAGGLAVLMLEERRRIATGGPMPYALAILGGVGAFAANEITSCSSALSCSP